ncbi:MAG: diguanylate cyclase [Syntrophobacteraceae bacterium]
MLDTLCELIIDELKTLSAQRRAISSSSLYEALSGKTETLNALLSREHVGALQNGYIRILEELACYLAPLHRQKAVALIEDIRNATRLAQLSALLDRIVSLLEQAYSDSLAKKETLEHLLLEVGNLLGELESESLALIEGTEQIQLANGRFTAFIQTEINELESATQSAEDVEAMREIFRARLHTIRTALETKKAEDRAKKQSFESTIQTLHNNLKHMQNKVERSQKQKKLLEHEALQDPLTGIANRRVLERQIRKEIKQFRREHVQFSVIFIDIDDFKTINDTYGHRVGDKCLQSLVGRIKQVLRQKDLVARYGGDEFVILLTDTGRNTAHMVADKLASAISKTCFIYRDTEIQLSVSIGLTQVEENDYNPDEIIARADSALYEAKHQGRDCIVVS